MKITFRTDSSSKIGTGHLMRCINFANYLADKNNNIEFICRGLAGSSANLVTESKYKLNLLKEDQKFVETYNPNPAHENWLETDWQNDACQTIEVIERSKPDLLILDHYALDKKWQKKVKLETGCKILVIDDLADREHSADILLDQNYHKSENLYHGLVNKNCKKFIGPQYALLKKEFFTSEKPNREHDNPQNLFIFFSGIDADGETLKTLQSLSFVSHKFAKVNVVCGSKNPKIIEIEDICLENSYHLHIDTKKMVELINAADIAIGAGGVNTWERCFLGVPTLVSSIAQNQEEISSDCDSIGYLKYIGKAENFEVLDFADEISQFIENIDLRKKIANNLNRDFNVSGLDEVIGYLKNEC